MQDKTRIALKILIKIAVMKHKHNYILILLSPHYPEKLISKWLGKCKKSFRLHKKVLLINCNLIFILHKLKIYVT